MNRGYYFGKMYKILSLLYAIGKEDKIPESIAAIKNTLEKA